ncbi:42569_t:CDS:2, partial [Gigaspora margarita]
KGQIRKNIYKIVSDYEKPDTYTQNSNKEVDIASKNMQSEKEVMINMDSKAEQITSSNGSNSQSIEQDLCDDLTIDNSFSKQNLGRMLLQKVGAL